MAVQLLLEDNDIAPTSCSRYGAAYLQVLTATAHGWDGGAASLRQ